MKVNNDCARDVLQIVESLDYNDYIMIKEVVSKLDKYEEKDVMNVINLFHKERIIIVEGKASYNDEVIENRNSINGFTVRGHITFDLIKNEELWQEIKSKLPDFNEVSIFYVVELARKIKSYRENKLFNIPEEYSSLNYRW